MNRFLYAEGNPWSMVDPSGHASAYEGGGCGPGGKYCGSTGNDQNFHKNIKTVLAKAHNDYVHHVSTRTYDPESTPTISAEWATGDTWGETSSIGRASAMETASQSAAIRCTPTRSGPVCQSAQQQADSAATMAGIGDAFGDIWNSALHAGSCAGNILNCVDVGLGLGMMAVNPIGTGQTIGAQRAAAINSGDKRAGAHAITSTAIDFASLLPVLGALRGGSVAEAALASESSGSIVPDWASFPDPDLAPTGANLSLVPKGPVYDALRAAANAANRVIRTEARAAGVDPTGMQVHEILPVKWGGDPVDPQNKVLLPAELHSQITTWWNELQRAMEAGG